MTLGRLLLADDDVEFLSVVEEILAAEGHAVRAVSDPARVLEELDRFRPDLVILDRSMPGLSGEELCQEIRRGEQAQVGILFLTAKDSTRDVVEGLGLGADDYLGKPFHADELLARVAAMLRRARSEVRAPTGSGVSIDEERHEVRVAGKVIQCTPSEYRLLKTLARRPGRVFSRDQLLDALVGQDADVYERTVDAHIRALRAKLGRFRGIIETVRGSGYRYNEPARS